jgi:Na+-transporting methylmalonyl-CoA/oxaloacetate decarboxylase gamma subunit
MELLNQTFTIMIVGMSLVFFFLFVVIQCMNVIAYGVRRYEEKQANNSVTTDDDVVRRRCVAAAIAVATHTATEKK